MYWVMNSTFNAIMALRRLHTGGHHPVRHRILTSRSQERPHPKVAKAWYR